MGRQYKKGLRMSRKTTTLTATVELIGRKENVRKVFKDVNLSGRNKTNKRTGQPYTVFGEVKEGSYPPQKNGPSGWRLSFPVTRAKIVGNTEKTLADHFSRAVQRSDEDVTVKLLDVQVTED